MALYLGSKKIKTYLSEAPLNNANDILNGSFSGEYFSDKLTSLKREAFKDMKNVTSVSLPNCTIFQGGDTFSKTDNLISVYLPNLTTINDAHYTFLHDKKLTELELPNLTSVVTGTALCYGASALTTVKFPKLSGNTIGNSWFNSTALTTLILGGDELNPLDNIHAFYKTPIESGTGHIYVPDNLVESYKTATNWSVFAEQIKPISELEEGK